MAPLSFEFRSKYIDSTCINYIYYPTGAAKCHCNPMTSSDIVHDRNSVCTAFCSVANIQLEGCSACAGEAFSDPNSASDVQTTTPNWDELCTLWCRMGEGGTLCNCDLPPFV